MKKLFYSGAVYIFIAILFAIGAVSKTISDDPNVITIQWLCAIVCALAGVMRFTRKTNR
jgi:hypothetical protein